jgi:uncharacterized protein
MRDARRSAPAVRGALAALALTVVAAGCGPNPRIPIARAAAGGSVDEVRRLLAAGAGPDDTDTAWTPLMFAARRGETDMMTALIDAGADLNRHDGRNQWTPLLHALHKEQRQAALLLVARGADPNQAGGGGETPLMFAALDNDTVMVRTLLAHGARADRRTASGETALDIAVAGGAFGDPTDRPLLGGCYPETVRLLVAAAPELRLRDGFGSLTARWWARLKGCRESLALVDGGA